MSNTNMTEREERLEHLKALKGQMEAVTGDFSASDEDVEKATACLTEIDKELDQINAMIANGEVFADGAHQEAQVSDETGGTYVDNGEGYLEPDLTSQSTAEGGSVKIDWQDEPVDEHPVKKPESKDKEVKPRSKKSSMTPGYNAKVNPDGKTTFVVGPTPPPYGYPPMPEYGELYDYTLSKDMTEENLKEIYATAERLLAEKFPEACKADSPSNAIWHEIVAAKAKDMIDAYAVKPTEMTEEEEPQGENGLIFIAREIFEKEGGGLALPYAPTAVKSVMDRMDAKFIDSKNMNEFRHQLHIECDHVMKGVTYFLGDWTESTTMEQMDKYADKILSHSERVDRIKQQYDRLVSQEHAYVSFAENYLNPEFLPFIQEQIKQSGKKVKYFDTLIARYQTKTYGSKLKISAPEKIANYLKPLSDKALAMLGAAREIVIKYDTKVVTTEVSNGSPCWPMSAFTKGNETTKLYIQGLGAKE